MLGKGEGKAGKWLPQAAFGVSRGAKIRMRFFRLSPRSSSFWCLSSAAGPSHEALSLLVHLVSQIGLVVMIPHFKALCWSWTLLGWSLLRAEPGCPTMGSSWQCLWWQVSTSTSSLTMPLQGVWEDEVWLCPAIWEVTATRVQTQLLYHRCSYLFPPESPRIIFSSEFLLLKIFPC